MKPDTEPRRKWCYETRYESEDDTFIREIFKSGYYEIDNLEGEWWFYDVSVPVKKDEKLRKRHFKHAQWAIFLPISDRAKDRKLRHVKIWEDHEWMKNNYNFAWVELTPKLYLNPDWKSGSSFYFWFWQPKDPNFKHEDFFPGDFKGAWV